MSDRDSSSDRTVVSDTINGGSIPSSRTTPCEGGHINRAVKAVMVANVRRPGKTGKSGESPGNNYAG